MRFTVIATASIFLLMGINGYCGQNSHTGDLQKKAEIINDKIKKSNFVPSQFLFEAGLIPKDELYAALVAKGTNEEA